MLAPALRSRKAPYHRDSIHRALRELVPLVQPAIRTRHLPSQLYQRNPVKRFRLFDTRQTFRSPVSPDCVALQDLRDSELNFLHIASPLLRFRVCFELLLTG